MRAVLVRRPVLPWPPLTVPQRSNEVWTHGLDGLVSHRGRAAWWIRSGCAICRSRFAVGVCVRPTQSAAEGVRASRGDFFGRFSPPKIIRVDNGTPFAGNGAVGLSHLSVWWLHLGIKVEFTRRARPGGNAAPEPFHRVLKAENGQPASRHGAAAAKTPHCLGAPRK